MTTYDLTYDPAAPLLRFYGEGKDRPVLLDLSIVDGKVEATYDPENVGEAARVLLEQLVTMVVPSLPRVGPTSREILEAQARRDRELDEMDPLEVSGEVGS